MLQQPGLFLRLALEAPSQAVGGLQQSALRRARQIACVSGSLHAPGGPEQPAPISSDDGIVRFHYRDRKDGDQKKIAALPVDEFLRRFLRHVLPKGFLRIRHYGLLANRRKGELLQRCRTHLRVAKPAPVAEKTTAEWILQLVGIDVTRCPRCGSKELERIDVPPLRMTCFKPKPATRDTS